MNRPVYETEEDRLNEAEAMIAYSKVRCVKDGGYRLKRMPSQHGWDYNIEMDDILKELVEIKVRSNPSGKYEYFMISKAKIDRFMDEAERLGVPACLLVRFEDGMFRCYLPPAEYEVQIGGRFDRNDKADTEPVYKIPMRLFAQLNIPTGETI